MKIAVTGSTGYVGAFSVKALVEAGHRVRLLVRDPAKAQAVLRAVGVTGRLDCVQGDMTDEASVLRALEGCTAALHCAAVVSVDPARGQEMLMANSRGTELVIGHAVRRGLDPVVHVSSVTAVLRPGAKRLTTDMPLSPLGRGYARSKVVAEEYVRKLQAQGAPILITYPGSVTGPAAGANMGEGSQTVVEAARMGLVPTRDGAFVIIDARDLGAIHAALMTPGRGPRRIMCGGHYVTAAEMARHMRTLTGRPFPVWPLSGAMLRRLARAADAVSRNLVKFTNPLTHEASVYFTQMPPTDDSAVHRELSIRYRDLDETLREAMLAAHALGQLSAEQIGLVAPRTAGRAALRTTTPAKKKRRQR